MTEILSKYVNWFRNTSPYINSHRGKTFLVMLPGDCIGENRLNNIVGDLVLLRSLGVRLVIVHGARTQIESELSSAGISSEFYDGVRITPKENITLVQKAVGATRTVLEANFSAGLPNSPMYGAKIRVRGGNFVTAMPQGVIDGIDYQYTGKVRNVDANGITELLDGENIVLLSPLGYSLTGEVFNLSFADVAIQTAMSIKADKLIVYNDDGPVCDAEGTQYREMTLLKCEKFLVAQLQKNQSNTYFSLSSCYRACDSGVPRSHIISSDEDGSLLKELFTRDGSGTMVYRDHYETIRRARIDDVGGIFNLIEPMEKQGILVKRSRELLETEINCFTVMEKDNLIIGCIALYPIKGSAAGELACVAIHDDYRRGGRAAKLLRHVERQSLILTIKHLYVLTTQTAHWFIEQGFTESHVDMLPVERKALYNFQRNSKVFVKPLA